MDGLWVSNARFPLSLTLELLDAVLRGKSGGMSYIAIRL
jgi:hypothetical protein